MFLPWPKATVLVASGPANDPDRKHLFVLLTHGLGEEEEVLMLSLSTLNPSIRCDDSCVIEPGEHPFVSRRSYVRYDKPRLVRKAAILRAVETGVFFPHQSVSDALYARICEGLLRSPFAAPATKAFLLWHQNLVSS